MPDRSFDNHRRGLCLITAAILAWPAITFAQTALLWPEHCLTKVLRTAEPPAAINPLKAAGARDEIVSAQAVFRSSTDIAAVTFVISDLKSESAGAVLSASAIKLRWERYIDSLRFSAQRDGIQDYEYLWVLENSLRQLKQQIGEKDAYWLDPRQRPLELCRRVIWSFHEYTRDPLVMLSTRTAVAEEIEALQTAPLLYVQTSPPDGSTVPAGPRHVTMRGLVTPGAKVTINGKPFDQVRPSGYFGLPCFLKDDEPTITVQVEHNGKTRTVTRTFKLTD